jgi:hypothetical protein
MRAPGSGVGVGLHQRLALLAGVLDREALGAQLGDEVLGERFVDAVDRDGPERVHDHRQPPLEVARRLAVGVGQRLSRAIAGQPMSASASSSRIQGGSLAGLPTALTALHRFAGCSVAGDAILPAVMELLGGWSWTSRRGCSGRSAGPSDAGD